MFRRLSQFVVARRLWVIAAWILAAVAIVPFSPALGDVTNSNEASFLPGSYESAQADALARKAFPDQSGASALLVFSRRDGRQLTAADERTVGATARAITKVGIDRVEGVQTGSAEQRSPDGKLARPCRPRRHRPHPRAGGAAARRHRPARHPGARLNGQPARARPARDRRRPARRGRRRRDALGHAPGRRHGKALTDRGRPRCAPGRLAVS